MTGVASATSKKTISRITCFMTSEFNIHLRSSPAKNSLFPDRVVVTSYVTRASKNLRSRVAKVFCAVAWLAFSERAFPVGLSYAGLPLTPGGMLQANLTLLDLQCSYV